MKNDTQLFDILLKEGLIGSELYKIVIDRNSTLGIIAGAALHASADAYENARKTHIPLVIQKGNFLCEIKSDGSERIIKYLPKNREKISKNLL